MGVDKLGADEMRSRQSGMTQMGTCYDDLLNEAVLLSTCNTCLSKNGV